VEESAMNYTEEQLRQVAVACFVNARDLYEDACLLMKHARYPRALVLAVIGAEEFVKSVAYTIAALNPSERVRLATVIPMLHYHDCKHLANASIEGVYIEIEEGVQAEADMAGVPVASGSYLRETLFELASLGLSWLLRPRGEAKEHAQTLNNISPNSAPSVAKERGLYVDMSSEGLYSPSLLDASEARSTVLGLEWSLETFRNLPSLLEDEHQWAPFAETIRQRLARLQ
jgi:AbiV family abortive infection protein